MTHAAPARPAGLSPVVAGAWRLAEWNWPVHERLRWIGERLDLGVTGFDHADIYGDYRVEALFGEALAQSPGLRERMQIVSKCGIKPVSPARPEHRIKHYDTSAAHIRASVEASLAALRTDRIDLLLIHRADALLDADEVAAEFGRLRRDGKVLHFGVSNFTMPQFALLNERISLATNQIELSPLHLEPLHDGTLDQAQALARAPMAWSPMAGGRLFTGDDERARRVRAELEALARERGGHATTQAIAWVLRHPSRPLPIIGSRRLEVIQDALDALAQPMDAQSWYRVWTASAGREVH